MLVQQHAETIEQLCINGGYAARDLAASTKR
jgi:hypothetical protein